MKQLLCAAGMLVVLQAAQASDLYRWVDEKGKVHYGDIPTEDAEKLKISVPPADSDATLPYETRMAIKNFRVSLYVFETCGEPCDKARDFLRKRKVPFTEFTLKTQDEIQAFKKKSGLDTAPALSVGHTWLSGFQSAQWQDELDAAGYPKQP